MSFSKFPSKSKGSVIKKLLAIPEDETEMHNLLYPDSEINSPPSDFQNVTSVPYRKELIIKRILNNQDKEFLCDNLSSDKVVGDNNFSYLSQCQKKKKFPPTENQSSLICITFFSLLIISVLIFIHWLSIPRKVQGTSNAFYS